MLQPQINERPATKSRKPRKSVSKPEEKDNTLMTKEEFFAKIDRARAQTGGTVLRSHEEIDAFLDSL